MSFKWGKKSKVISNRNNFLKKFDLSLGQCVVIQAEHKNRVVVVRKGERGRGAENGEDGIVGEALITSTKGVVLFLLTADCLPIAYYDLKNHVIALAHLGWKPTNKGLASKVIKGMENRFGSKPKDILVSIGPGIHKNSYIFKNPIQKELPNWSQFLEDDKNGMTKVDIVGFNKDELNKAGILDKNIFISKEDTGKSKKFFSHYYSTKNGSENGRFATILGLR